MDDDEFVHSVADVCEWSVRGIEFIDNAGSVNQVARVSTSDGEVIVRFHRDPLRANEFAVESWCARAAAVAGVPTPACLADGVLDGRPYGVQEFVDGSPPLPTVEIWRRLGEYARLIALVDLRDAPDGLFGRFGRDVPSAWRSHAEYNLSAVGEGDPLVELGVYEFADAQRIAALLQKTIGAAEFGLSHGDLKPQNLIRDDSGELVLIDWGCAQTGPVPWLDAVVVAGREASHQETPGSTTWFLNGCGTSMHPEILDAHRLLKSLDLLRWSMDRRPDLIDGYRQAAGREVRRTVHGS